MKKLELLIPPAVVLLVHAGLVWLIDFIFPFAKFKTDLNLYPAILLFLIGCLLGAAGILTFFRAATTINPSKPDQAHVLVTKGVYKLSRNPMYLGLFFILFAWIVFLGNAISLLCLFLFVAYMNRFQIKPEERKLKEKFGADYDGFLKRTKRWL